MLLVSITVSLPVHIQKFCFTPQKNITNCGICKYYPLKPNRIGLLYETLYVNMQQQTDEMELSAAYAGILRF